MSESHAIPSFVLGSYTAARSGAANSAPTFAKRASELPGVTGLEMPVDELHLFESEHTRPRGQHIVTFMPTLSGLLKSEPRTGLASAHEVGRQAAVESVDLVRARIVEIQARWPAAISAVVLQSSASAGFADADALLKSLDSLSARDWGGARIVLEHCDAPVDGLQPQKGYLPLADEIRVVQTIDRGIGTLINWGRTAIEYRSARGPIEQLEFARSEATLCGLVFSGVSDSDGAFGPAWADKHLPTQEWLDTDEGGSDSYSLLDDAQITKCLEIVRAASAIQLYGAKIASPLSRDDDHRLEMLTSISNQIRHGMPDS